MIYLLAFMAGAVAEWVSEYLGVKYTNAVNGRYADISEQAMKAKVWRARKHGLALLLLSHVDNTSIFGGFWVYVCVVVGAACGGWSGLGWVMWAKWRDRNDDD